MGSTGTGDHFMNLQTGASITLGPPMMEHAFDTTTIAALPIVEFVVDIMPVPVLVLSQPQPPAPWYSRLWHFLNLDVSVVWSDYIRPRIKSPWRKD